MNIQEIQDVLQKTKIDFWLITDYQRTNFPALKFLNISPDVKSTRRWFYLIPRQGAPIRLVHSVETSILNCLPGDTQIYFGRQSLIDHLHHLMPTKAKVAMEYSPKGNLPNISRVDAGTIELIRSLGVEVVSSANLLQWLGSRWSEAALESHRKAASVLRNIVDEVWNLVSNHLKTGDLTEFDIQKFILKQIKSNDCTIDHPPIVAVNEHSADPHFSLTTDISRPIEKNQLLLIDLWCKTNSPCSVYADMTWTAWTGPSEPDPMVNRIFTIVRDARDATVNAVLNAFATKRPVTGADLDRVARQYITDQGYGNYFVHRTGHSLDADVHGAGANLDSLESEDDRTILPGTGFTIEPGIYLPGKFGIRSELNIAILKNGEVEITGQPIQKSLARLTS